MHGTFAALLLAVTPREEIDILEAWAAPLIGRGEIRPLPGGRLHALIFGPAELAARQWFQAASAENPLSLVDDLGEAAWATIQAKPAPSSSTSRRPRPRPVDRSQSKFNL